MGANLSGIADKLGGGDILSNSINHDCVVVFSNPACTYCKKLKELLNKEEIQHTDYEISSFGKNAGELVSKLRARTGMLTVPQVFINGTFVGGYSEVEYLKAAGELYDLIKQCSKKPKPS